MFENSMFSFEMITDGMDSCAYGLLCTIIPKYLDKILSNAEFSHKMQLQLNVMWQLGADIHS
jgi:hypothetical protein